MLVLVVATPFQVRQWFSILIPEVDLRNTSYYISFDGRRGQAAEEPLLRVGKLTHSEFRKMSMDQACDYFNPTRQVLLDAIN